MTNKIGIIGIGVIGEATKYGMEKLGHKVFAHDIRFDTTIDIVKNTEICFICVPTPSRGDYGCDTSIVESVVNDLNEIGYQGIIAIKSTITPATTKKLQQKHKNNKICFVPEFLRERCAIADFTQNHDVCIIGSESPEICEFIKKIHGKYPKDFVFLTPTEAEFVKYYNNIYNATLITLANNFYEVCVAMDVDYDKVKGAVVRREHINDVYMDCNENFRGYAGACLPKDVSAFIHLSKLLNLDTGIFEFLDNENKKYKSTVFEGMRK